MEIFPGGLLEKPDSGTGALVGPTFSCLLKQQFQSLRDGDRFFFTHQEGFIINIYSWILIFLFRHPIVTDSAQGNRNTLCRGHLKTSSVTTLTWPHCNQESWRRKIWPQTRLQPVQQHQLWMLYPWWWEKFVVESLFLLMLLLDLCQILGSPSSHWRIKIRDRELKERIVSFSKFQ